MILMRENPFRGPLEGVGPENRDCFGPWNGNEQSECHLGPEMAMSEVSAIWAQKSQEFLYSVFCILYSVFCTVCCEFVCMSFAAAV